MYARYLRFMGIGFGLIAASCEHGNDLERYYPLDAGFIWSYSLTIRRAADSGDPIKAASTVTNLPTRTLNGRAVTPQETRQFDQIQLRFISEEVDGIAEIALQSPGQNVPQPKNPPNYVLKRPLQQGNEWSSTWQSNQFGTVNMIPINKRIEELHRARTSAAGQFADCLRLQITGRGAAATPNGLTAIKVAGEEWYCADIGFVEGVFREELPDLPANTTVISIKLTDHGR
jgi:hypothetical protein